MAARLDHLDPEFDGGGRLFGGGASRVMAFLATLVLLPMVSLYVGAALAHLAPRPGFRRACRHVAAVVTFALAGLVVLAAVRAAQHPSFNDYLANLEDVASLSPPGVITGHGGIDEPRYVAWGPGPLGERRHEARGLIVVLQCEEAGCRMALVGDSGAPPSMVDHQNAPLQRWDAAIELKRDPATGGLFVLSGHGASLERRAIAEFHHRDGRWVPATFDPRHITNRASPPVAWVLGGVGGFLLMAVGVACVPQATS